MAGKGQTSRQTWDRVKAEYLAGAKAADLAAKYKVNVATLTSKASREKWGEQRRQVASQVQAEMPGLVADAVLTEAHARVTEHLRVLDLILQEAVTRLSAMDPVLTMFGEQVIDKETGKPKMQRHVKDAKHLDSLTNVVKKVIEAERTALGLIDPNKVKVGDKPPETVGPDGQPLTGVIALPPLEPPPAPPDDEEEEDASE